MNIRYSYYPCLRDNESEVLRGEVICSQPEGVQLGDPDGPGPELMCLTPAG